MSDFNDMSQNEGYPFEKGKPYVQAQSGVNPFEQGNPYIQSPVQQPNSYNSAAMQQGTTRSGSSDFNGARSGVMHSGSFGNNKISENQGTSMDIKAVVSIICGILGIVGSWIPIVKYLTVIVSIVSIILGIFSVKNATTSKGAAITGLILGGIGLLMFIGGMVVSIVFTNMLVDGLVSLFN